jgi:NAD-dependent deacetylase
VTALTGAGVSAESGIPTFRGPGGLWRGRDPASLATPEAFQSDPLAVWEWYDWRRGIIASAEPNDAHRALSRLEEEIEGFLLITQNVDGLHQAAGSRRIVELHGNLWRLRCTSEGTRHEDRRVPLDPLPPVCSCGALLRPDVVWFGEPLPVDALESALRQASRCEVMIVAGTSTIVQPAASLPLTAKQAGAWIVEVNPEPTPLSSIADHTLRGNAGEILPRLVSSCLAGRTA